MFILILFYGFLVYLLYRLIVNFIIPVYKATRQVKRGFQHMHDRMNGQAPYETQSHGAHKKKPHLNKVGEYIDFEDVR